MYFTGIKIIIIYSPFNHEGQTSLLSETELDYAFDTFFFTKRKNAAAIWQMLGND
jgi:hypothetical protein